MTGRPMPRPEDDLRRLFGAALDAVEPGAALARALAAEAWAPAARTWVLGLGKAAHALSRAAVAHLRENDLEPAGGLVIATEHGTAPAAGIEVVAGDHPLPGPGSGMAAAALENVVRSVRPGDNVWVLLSGGTTSLIAAPVRGIPDADLHDAFATLLHSGLDIHEMNQVRKRLSRWSAGRLAAALAHANIHVFAVSDVVGDDISSIASGPCAPNAATVDRVRALLAEADLITSMPKSVIDLLDRTARGLAPETPKPGDSAFRRVETSIVASNRTAVEAVAREAARLGYRVRVRRKPIAGDAASCGAAIARRLIALADGAGNWTSTAAADGATRPICYVAGGETTVEIRASSGRGGRCQETALAAARTFSAVPAPRLTLLAAGTDGRDGPTDAAGAIVDNNTWDRIRSTGRDPDVDLANHNAYSSLDAAGALVRTGPTGTNVADVVIAIVA